MRAVNVCSPWNLLMICNKDRENSLYIMIWLETISQEFERCVLEVRLLVGRREGFGAPSSHIRIAKALARRRRLLGISAPKPYTIRDAHTAVQINWRSLIEKPRDVIA